MKVGVALRSMLALGLAFESLTVFAQSSVTLYGVVDQAVAYVNNQHGHSNVQITQGNLYASKWGLRGTEELGGGSSAIFDVENGFSPNTGAFSSSSQEFNRQAYMGLANKTYGTVTVGRQYTPYYLLVAPLDSSHWLTGATGAHPGDIDGLDTSIRVNDAIDYTSPVWNGLQISAMYAFGGIAGAVSRGQTYSAAVNYTNGPVGVAAGYLLIDNAAPGTNAFSATSTAGFTTSAVNTGYVSAHSIQHVTVASNYKLGKWVFGLNYANVEYTPNAQSLFRDTALFNTYSALAVYNITPSLLLGGGFSYVTASKANGIHDAAHYEQYSLKASYALSPRATLYAIAAFQNADGQTLGAAGASDIVSTVATVGDSQQGSPSSTARQFVSMVGLAFAF